MREFLTGVLLPAAVTAVLLFPLARAKRPAVARWAGAAVLALGFTAGFFACFGLRTFPPSEHWHWLVPLVGVAALGASLQHVERLPRALRALFVGVVIGAFGALIVPRFVDPAAARLAWRIAAGGLLALAWLATTWGSARAGDRTIAIVLWSSASALALFLLIVNTARFAQLAGVSAACMGAFVLAALWRPALHLAISAAPVAGTIALGLALLAMFYADEGAARTPFLLAGVAAGFPGLGRLFGVHRLGGWRAGLVNVILVLIPLGVAIGWALGAKSSAPTSEYDYEY